MWELDHKESWLLKNWCFWIVVLQKTPESPLDCKEIQPVHPKGDQSSVFIGRTDVEAETPILWPPEAKSWLIWKDADAGKDWGQEEKGTTEDELVEWHHWSMDMGLGGLWALVMDRHGGLACCGSWHCKESDTTERLNWTELGCTGLPRWLSGKEAACQCRRPGFNPLVRKIPCRQKWKTTPIFLTGKSQGQRSLVGYSSWNLKESDKT